MNRSICLFTAEFPYGLQETFLENELDYLSQNFDKIYIVPLFKHTSERQLQYQNIEVMTPVNNSRNVTIHKFMLLIYLTFWRVLFLGCKDAKFHPKKFIKVLKQAFIVTRLKKYLAKRNQLEAADLWYFYWGTNAISVLPFLERHPKSVARYHGYDLYDSDKRRGEFQIFQKEAAQKLKRAFFIANAGKCYFEEKYGRTITETELSKLGVPDRGQGNPSTDGVLRIVTCSNLYPVKRVHLVAEALKLIDGIPIHWTHFGDGPKELKLKLLNGVAELGSNVNFTFMGRVRNQEAMGYYVSNSVDLFINVSESEGLPVSIMEALSFGVPVIATDAGGTGELINELNGELLKVDLTGHGLAKSIRKFYNTDYQNIIKRQHARNAWLNNVDAEKNYKSFCNTLRSL